jgi:hypothetical protein
VASVQLVIVLSKPLVVASATGRGAHQTSTIDWKVGAPSVLRLHQLLAELDISAHPLVEGAGVKVRRSVVVAG